MSVSADLVSVVVPNYNGERYLNQAIESVQRQTYPGWEMIVVDDLSTDGSVSVVEDYARTDSRIRLMRLERNSGGPSMPRNAGVEASRGRYVAFMDADDIWHPQKLEIQMGFVRSHGARFCSTALLNFHDPAEISAQLARNFMTDEPQAWRVDHAALLRKNAIPTSSVVVERELLLRHPFTLDPRYLAIEDYLCWLQIHQHEIPHSWKLRDKLTYYRVSESSISRSKLAMLRKNHMMFSEYRVRGRELGLKKYYYLATYVYRSILDRMARTRA